MASDTPGTAQRDISPWRRRLSFTQDALLVVTGAWFCYVHAHAVVAHQTWTSLPFAIEQAIYVTLFLSRRRSRQTSHHPSDWVFATIGGWGPLVLQLHPSTSEVMRVSGIAVQTIGLVLSCVGFMWLGKSFGIVAANRGLKTSGPYRFVRHPIYASHTVTLLGFAVANLWWFNVVIVGIVLTGQLFRMAAEERVLTATDEYRAYAREVRWRLVPGVF